MMRGDRLARFARRDVGACQCSSGRLAATDGGQRRALLTLLSGLFLAECALLGWLKVPLTCAHEPSPQALRSRPFVYAVALNLFVFVGANLQFTALRSATATLQLLTALGAATIVLRVWQRAAQKDHVIEFDAPDDARIETLDLSEALH